MNNNNVWIIGAVALLVLFGIIAAVTGNAIWWTFFGIVIALFGVYWWIIRPNMAKKS